MPKEIVYDNSPNGFNAIVSWSRGEHGSGYVQIATEMREPQTSDAPQNLRDLVLSWAGSSSDPEHAEGARGLWTTLDRAGINRLIRALRRARDQAFGADA